MKINKSADLLIIWKVTIPAQVLYTFPIHVYISYITNFHRMSTSMLRGLQSNSTKQTATNIAHLEVSVSCVRLCSFVDFFLFILNLSVTWPTVLVRINVGIFADQYFFTRVDNKQPILKSSFFGIPYFINWFISKYFQKCLTFEKNDNNSFTIIPFLVYENDNVVW